MKTATIRVGYAGVHLSTYYAVEHDQFGRATRGLSSLAGELGFELVPAPHPIEGREQAEAARRFLDGKDLDLLILHAAACSLADPLLELARLNVPIALWGVPEPTLEGDIRINSFVTLEIYASTLRSYFGRGDRNAEGRTYKWFYGEVDEPAFADRLGVTIRALRAAKTLRSSRIGLVGDLAPGFYNLSFDEAVLRSRFGVEIVRHPIQEILEVASDSFAEEAIRGVRDEMAAKARAVNVDSAAMDRAAASTSRSASSSTNTTTRLWPSATGRSSKPSTSRRRCSAWPG